MIHSMSGGVIKDPGSYTFVRVLVDGDDFARWYVTDLDIEEGDRVRVPAKQSTAVGTVMRVERDVSGQVTPVPLKSAKKIICRM